MDDARLISVRLVRAISFSLLLGLVLLATVLSVKTHSGFSPAQNTLLSLPSSLLWQDACYKKFSSPAVIPASVLEQLPFTREFSSFDLLLSPSGQDFVLAATPPSDWNKKRLETELKAILARNYPKKQDLILPDDTKIQELIYSPAGLKTLVLPSGGLNLIKIKGKTSWLFAFKGKLGIITNKPDLAFSLYLSQNLLSCE